MQEQTGARLEALDGNTLALTGVDFEGDLRGPLFECTIQQRFANTSNRNTEVVYTFPLPWGAVLLGVDVLLGDKRLSGFVIEKKAAEGEYEQAMADGDAAVMLERNPDGSYSLNLGNLLAGEVCVITLRYAQTLQFEKGGLRLMIPTTLAPRYGDALTTSSLQPHHAVAARLDVAYPFELTVRLHGNLSSARVASPSHSVSVAYSGRDGGNFTSVALLWCGSPPKIRTTPSPPPFDRRQRNGTPQ
jgi:Ca-activated chloride channel homolog